jgi:hypothetical protein
LSYTSSPFCSGFLEMGGVSWTICLGWSWAMIFLNSAS